MPNDVNSRINAILDEARDDNGRIQKDKIIVPEDATDEFKAALANERKYRDTQAGYTSSQQLLKTTQAQLDELTVPTTIKVVIPDEIEELKTEDPEKWRQEVNRIEDEARKNAEDEASERRNTASEAAIKSYREEALKNFVAETGFVITDEIIANDLPQRFMHELKPETNFTEWLYKAKAYLTRGKKVSNPDTKTVTDLDKHSSGHTSEQELSLEDLYKKAMTAN